MHSQEYKSPRGWEGKKVVVVGACTSGGIACCISLSRGDTV